MSENENLVTAILDSEELPLEDQKKAINLQDLIYIKKYIDDNHYDIEETDAMLKSAATNAVKDVAYTKSEIDANHYNKTEINNKHYTKTEIDNNNYTKTQADNTFYKKTETVNRAVLAERVAFTTVAPTASPAAGSLIICFLEEEPATKYDRVIYLIGG